MHLAGVPATGHGLSASYAALSLAHGLHKGHSEKEIRKTMTTLVMKTTTTETTPERLAYAKLEGVLRSQKAAAWSYVLAGIGFAAGTATMLSQLL